MPTALHGPSPFQRAIRRGILAAWRTKNRGSVFALLVSVMTLLQLIAVAAAGTHAVHGMLITQSALRIEVLPTADDQDIQEFYATIRALPYVSSVDFVPSEKAYEQERARAPDLVSFLEQYDVANPFPDRFSIALNDVSDFSAFSNFVSDARWSAVVDPSFISTMTVQENDVRQLLSITAAIRTFFAVLLVVVLGVLFLLVYEIVVSNTQKHEGALPLESTMGGQPSMALVPLVMEMGVLVCAAGIMGTGIAAVGMYIAAVFVPLWSGFSLTSALLSLVPTLLASEVVVVLVVIVAAVVMAIGRKKLWPSPVR